MRWRRLKGLLIVAAIVAAFPVIGFEVFWRMGLRSITELPVAAPSNLAAKEKMLLWRDVTGTDDTRVDGIYLWTVLRTMMHPRSEPKGLRSVSRVANDWALAQRRGRTQFDWLVANFSLSVWLSRNWSADELLSQIFRSTYLGRDIYGFDNAGRAYFDKPFADLIPEQQALLFAVERNPARLCQNAPQFTQDRNRVLADSRDIWGLDEGRLAEATATPLTFNAGVCEQN